MPDRVTFRIQADNNKLALAQVSKEKEATAKWPAWRPVGHCNLFNKSKRVAVLDTLSMCLRHGPALGQLGARIPSARVSAVVCSCFAHAGVDFKAKTSDLFLNNY